VHTDKSLSNSFARQRSRAGDGHVLECDRNLHVGTHSRDMYDSPCPSDSAGYHSLAIYDAHVSHSGCGAFVVSEVRCHADAN
jgi:hypothetical protein